MYGEGPLLWGERKRECSPNQPASAVQVTFRVCAGAVGGGLGRGLSGQQMGALWGPSLLLCIDSTGKGEEVGTIHSTDTGSAASLIREAQRGGPAAGLQGVREGSSWTRPPPWGSLENSQGLCADKCARLCSAAGGDGPGVCPMSTEEVTGGPGDGCQDPEAWTIETDHAPYGEEAWVSRSLEAGQHSARPPSRGIFNAKQGGLYGELLG